MSQLLNRGWYGSVPSHRKAHAEGVCEECSQDNNISVDCYVHRLRLFSQSDRTFSNGMYVQWKSALKKLSEWPYQGKLLIILMA